MGKIPKLKSLRITNPRVTAAGLAALAAESRVEELYYGGPVLDDDGVAAILSIETLKKCEIRFAEQHQEAEKRVMRVVKNRLESKAALRRSLRAEIADGLN